jgi:DNA processing protein
MRRNGTGLARTPGPTGTSLAEERQSWVVLATVEGVGDRTLERLVLTHGSATRVLELAAAGRLGRGIRDDADAEGSRTRTLPARTHAGIHEAALAAPARLAALADMRLWTLTLLDPDFPPRLRRIPDPPLVLFGRGDPALLHHPATVAIVGTRRPTPAGRVMAARAARGLAMAGVAVVSGLAVGIDGAAHAATAEADRPTLAVIGSGHMRPGPRAHRALLDRILEAGGAVVGELPPAAHATRGTYPRRNRLISGFADAVVVVEAPERSGALSTAHHALAQGIPLHVYAGGGTRAPWAGCRRLLSETAAGRFETVDELLGLLLERDDAGPSAVSASAVSASANAFTAPTAVQFGLLGAHERRVAGILATGPVSADSLAILTGLAPGVVAALLTMLQLRGLATTLGPLNLPAGALLSPGLDLSPGPGP